MPVCRFFPPQNHAMTTGLLSLPPELLLQILEYVVDNGPHAGLTSSVVPVSGHGGTSQTLTNSVLDPTYSSAACLQTLLVCRRLQEIFTKVAFQRTVFVVSGGYCTSLTTFQPLQHHQLESLRSIILLFEPYRFGSMTSWKWPFNVEALHLDTLTIAFTHTSPGDPRASDQLTAQNTLELVRLLRKLEHVKRLRFMQNGTFANPSFRTWYSQLVGLVLKEDHYQRYDASGGPHIESTWWSWHFNAAEKSFEFVARPVKAVVPEPSYMEMVAPLVAQLMSEMELAST